MAAYFSCVEIEPNRIFRFVPMLLMTAIPGAAR
jgi:hypothetical protein